MTAGPIEPGRPTQFPTPKGNRRANNTTASALRLRCGQENWTSRYVEGRRRVLGGWWRIPADAEAAAARLIELAGGRWRAEQWAAELTAAIRQSRR